MGYNPTVAYLRPVDVVTVNYMAEGTNAAVKTVAKSIANNTTLFARVAKEFNVPTVLTAVETESFSGYIWP